MKKAKISLALVGALAATIGLSACNEVTAKDNVVLTYGDGVSLTAKELYEDYQSGQSALSTNFDKVYELLVRKYYKDGKGKNSLNEIEKKARNSVNEDMKKAHSNAESSGASYAEEFEKILKSHSVETIDDDFEYWVYQHEKEAFEKDFYKDKIEALKTSGFTGTSTQLNNGDWLTKDNAEIKDEGFLKEKMPYHVRHILRKVSASKDELAQGQITKDEAKKLAKVVIELAKGESSFGEIAEQLSEDSSNTKYGDLEKMDLDTSFVNEFKLGVYAFDTLYNKTSDSYRNENKNRIAPVEDKKVLGTDGNEISVSQYFADKGIGKIPYGAAIALSSAAEEEGDGLSYKVNDKNATFFPRNILFNKYFNKHNVCVITPDDIPFNQESFDGEDSTKIAEYSTDEGTYPNYPEFADLDGFKNHDTTSVLGFNALTDTQGHIVLVVRAGADSYQGVHFITIERSALDYGPMSPVSDKDEANLAEYWTNEYTDSEAFPSYLKEGVKTQKTTFVNYFRAKTATYKDRADEVTGWIKNYNTNINSFIFAWLVNDGSIKFEDAEFEANLKDYCQRKILTSRTDAEKARSDSWKTYAEYLIHQDSIRDAELETGTGYLISETCAMSYRSEAAKNKTGLWAIGGACYGK